MTTAPDIAAVIPDSVEPVVGWRAWKTERTYDGLRMREEWFLRSWAIAFKWIPGTRVEAQCLGANGVRAAAAVHQSHESPGIHCRCGVYATLEPYMPNSWVVGKVAMWGTVIPGLRGWRAQYAYPQEIHLRSLVSVPGSRVEEARQSLERYGVPVFVKKIRFE